MNVRGYFQIQENTVTVLEREFEIDDQELVYGMLRSARADWDILLEEFFKENYIDTPVTKETTVYFRSTLEEDAQLVSELIFSVTASTNILGPMLSAARKYISEKTEEYIEATYKT
jgi:hypothetical protein